MPAPLTGGHTFVTGAGKAAVAMAAALAQTMAAAQGPRLSGAVVTRYGHAAGAPSLPPGLVLLEAGHPVPDEASVAAGTRMLAIARQATPRDRLFFLVSGGASALLVQPAPGLSLGDKQALTRKLLLSGADIADINGVRPKLSGIKGGRLAAAAGGAEIIVLAVSDIPGDDAALIGSGPCSPDPVSLAGARAILQRLGVDPGPRIQACLADPAREPLPGDHPAFARCTLRIIARSADAVAAAAQVVAGAGFEAVILTEARAPARELARTHAAAVAVQIQAGRRCALISGGETTVALTAAGGPGGRNTEYLLALGLELEQADLPNVHALAMDTDGIDGTGPHGGALLTPDTLHRCREAGLDPGGLLAGHRSAEAFAAAGTLLVPGPTGTNVNDLRIILVTP